MDDSDGTRSIAQQASYLLHLCATFEPSATSTLHLTVVPETQLIEMVGFLVDRLRHESKFESISQVFDLLLLSQFNPALSIDDNLHHTRGPTQSGVCGTVWSRQEYAYKCRTCERDPTCVICIACFKAGDHRGHDYALVRTGGGCCDCGDPQAWRREGFCPHHPGPPSFSDHPENALDSTFRDRLKAVVTAVAAHILQFTLAAHRRTVKDRSVSFAAKEATGITLVNWLSDVCSSDAVRRFVGSLLTDLQSPIVAALVRHHHIHTVLEADRDAVLGSSWLSLMLRVDGLGRLPSPLQVALHNFYFNLIKDIVFKTNFFKAFVSNYERFIHAHLHYIYLDSKPDNKFHPRVDIVQSFSVQLFTVPALVSLMVQEGGLLDVMLRVLLNLFEVASAPLQYETAVPYEQSAFHSKCPNARENARRNTWPNSTPQHTQKSITPHMPSSASSPHHTASPTLSADPLASPGVLDVISNIGQNEADAQNAAQIDDGEEQRSEDHVQTDVLVVLDVRMGEDNQDDVLMNEVGGNQNMPNPNNLDDDDDDNNNNNNNNDIDIENNRDEQVANGTEQQQANEGTEIVDIVTDVVTDLEFDHQRREIRTIDVMIDTNEENATIERDVIRIPEEFTMMGRLVNINTDSPEGHRETRRMGLFRRAKEQVKAFEIGLLTELPPYILISNDPINNFQYLKAVQCARDTELAALNGSEMLAHSLRMAWTTEKGINVDKLISKVMSDLAYLFGHKAVAFHFLHVRTRPLRTFLRMVSITQGMFALKRQFGEHARSMSNDWSRGLQFESEIYRLLDLMMEPFCAHSTSKFTQQFGEAVVPSGIDLPASRLNIVRTIRTCVDGWIWRETAFEALKTYAGEEFTAAHGVSIYLPLHRLLSMMTHHVVRVDRVDAVTAFGMAALSHSQQKQKAKMLLMHPLRLQSYLSQVRAGMWRRNGQAVNGQEYIYSQAAYSEWYVELDLFLLQCCSTILGPECFMQEVLRSYRVKNLEQVIELLKYVPKDEATEDTSESFQFQSVAPGETILIQTHTAHNDETMTNSESASPIDTKSKEDSISSDSVDGSVFGVLPLVPKHLIKNGQVSGADLVPNMGNTKEDLSVFMQAIVEELLVLIVRVATDRSRCGQSKMELLECRIIHELAVEDRTFSLLKSRCLFITISNETQPVNDELSFVSDEDSNDDETLTEASLEQVLAKVADFIPPVGMKHGTYRLKDSMWRLFDPFFAHLARRERCSAEVRHANLAKQKKLYSTQTIPIQKTCERSVYQAFDCLNEIAETACGQTVHALATTIFNSSLPKEGDSGYWVGLVAAVSQLLAMTLERRRDENDTKNWLNGMATSEMTFKKSIVGGLCAMASDLQTNHMSLYLELKSCLERIVQETYKLGDEQMKALLERFASHALPKHLLSKKAAASSSVDGDNGMEDELTPEEKRRKFLLKKKKEQQAAAMKRMLEAQKKFAESIEEEDEQKSDKGTVQTSSPLSISKSNRDSDAISSSQASPKQETQSTAAEHSQQRDECAVDAEEENCVLCHGACYDEDGLGRMMGRIGHQQRTRIPTIAQRTCNSEPREGESFNLPFGCFLDTDAKYNMSETMDEKRSRNRPSNSSEPACQESRDQNGSCVTSRQSDPGPSMMVTNSMSDSKSQEYPESGHEMFFSMKPVLHGGYEQGKTVHVSLCGHSVHIDCFTAFYNSLLRSKARQMVFAGSDIIDLERYEFLCPGCRKLSNLVVPTVEPFLRSPKLYKSPNRTKESNLSYIDWMKETDSDITKYQPAITTVGSLLSEWHRHGTINLRLERQTIFLKKVLRIMNEFRFNGRTDWDLPASNVNDVDSTNTRKKTDPVSSSDLSTWFAQCALTAVGCLEIASRSVDWDDTLLTQSRKSLRQFLKICRDFINVFDEDRYRTLRCLWLMINKSFKNSFGNSSTSSSARPCVDDKDVFGSNKKRRVANGRESDPFAMISLLVLVFDRVIYWEDAKMIVRMGLELLYQGYSGSRNGDEDETKLNHMELLWSVVLFCRRSFLLFTAVAPVNLQHQDYEIFDGRPFRLRQYGREMDVAGGKEEAQELLKLFDVDMKDLTSIIDGINADGKTSCSKNVVPKAGFLPMKIGLISLNKEYTSLLEELEEGQKHRCVLCKSANKPRAICLICGAFICDGLICSAPRKTSTANVGMDVVANRNGNGDGNGNGTVANGDGITAAQRAEEQRGTEGDGRRGGTRTRVVQQNDQGNVRATTDAGARDRERGHVQRVGHVAVIGEEDEGGDENGDRGDEEENEVIIREDNDNENHDAEDEDNGMREPEEGEEMQDEDEDTMEDESRLGIAQQRQRMQRIRLKALEDHCMTHTESCGCGVGVTLSEPQSWTGVVIRRGRRNTSWGSLFLDVHGEGDLTLSKGKALFLSDARYSMLERLWILHAFDQDSYILQSGIAQAQAQLLGGLL